MRQPTERQSLVSRVKALAEALEDSEVSELDISEGGTRVVLRRRLEPPPIAPTSGGRGASPRSARTRRAGGETLGPASTPDPGVAIIAPLTGVFYVASSPSAPPLAQVGEPVQAGQIVCVIEAMKVFNEIKSEVSGTVTAIVAQNGQLVHKGDAMIRIKSL
ncbi:MAG: biotin/lipoyl-binding protein [Ktedonobacterales bacterium]|nr:biotin/lipoyl-binding protein [Ktedonobacterales bacterium]